MLDSRRYCIYGTLHVQSVCVCSLILLFHLLVHDLSLSLCHVRTCEGIEVEAVTKEEKGEGKRERDKAVGRDRELTD